MKKTAEINRLERKISGLNARTSHIVATEEKMATVKKLYDQTLSEKHVCEGEIIEIKRELKKVYVERDKLMKEKEDYTKTLGVVKTEHAGIKTALELKLNSTREIIDKLTLKNKEDTVKMEGSMKKIRSELQTKVMEKQNEIERITARFNATLEEQKNHKLLQNEITAQKQNYLKLELKCEDLERKTRASKDELAAVRSKLETSKISMQKEIKSSNEMKQKQNEEIQSLRDEITSMTTKFSILEAEYEHLKTKSKADLSDFETEILVFKRRPKIKGSRESRFRGKSSRKTIRKFNTS